MKTFEEALELCTVLHDANDTAAAALMYNRVATFHNEARNNPIAQLLVEECSQQIMMATVSITDEKEYEVTLHSYIYSILMHGVAVGREMERVDLGVIVR